VKLHIVGEVSSTWVRNPDKVPCGVFCTAVVTTSDDVSLSTSVLQEEVIVHDNNILSSSTSKEISKRLWPPCQTLKNDIGERRKRPAFNAKNSTELEPKKRPKHNPGKQKPSKLQENKIQRIARKQSNQIKPSP
jgi:hypothetical protein